MFVVQALGETIPMLMKKLDKLQNHSAQMPNISENINRIRQLIQQARNAASKVNAAGLRNKTLEVKRQSFDCFPSCFSSSFLLQVGVPVKFNGKSGVQVRTPRNLADLASYTSLKFYITLPEGTRGKRQDNGNQQFVFYLGNKDVSINTTTVKVAFLFVVMSF